MIDRDKATLMKRGTMVIISKERELTLQEAIVEHAKGDYIMLSFVQNEPGTTCVGNRYHIRLIDAPRDSIRTYEVILEHKAWPVMIIGLLPVEEEKQMQQEQQLRHLQKLQLKIQRAREQMKQEEKQIVQKQKHQEKQAEVKKVPTNSEKDDHNPTTEKYSPDVMAYPDYIISVPYKRMGAKPFEENGEGVLLACSKNQFQMGTGGYLAVGDYVNLSFVIPRTKTQVVAMTKVTDKNFVDNSTIVTLLITDMASDQLSELLSYHKSL
ncbi:PilZ domain-containing protein [Brevibacillus daliensis]|uniref:PilZ domain-containing protein n=1 Tax=Brevibacillus daliensis TaxID=2892995 RepID=UPI001E36A61D|nr:PilZ domain-containing protein [Brevibacillus daliensis]